MSEGRINIYNGNTVEYEQWEMDFSNHLKIMKLWTVAGGSSALPSVLQPLAEMNIEANLDSQVSILQWLTLNTEVEKRRESWKINNDSAKASLFARLSVPFQTVYQHQYNDNDVSCYTMLSTIRNDHGGNLDTTGTAHYQAASAKKLQPEQSMVNYISLFNHNLMKAKEYENDMIGKLAYLVRLLNDGSERTKLRVDVHLSHCHANSLSYADACAYLIKMDKYDAGKSNQKHGLNINSIKSNEEEVDKNTESNRKVGFNGERGRDDSNDSGNNNKRSRSSGGDRGRSRERSNNYDSNGKRYYRGTSTDSYEDKRRSRSNSGGSDRNRSRSRNGNNNNNNRQDYKNYGRRDNRRDDMRSNSRNGRRGDKRDNGRERSGDRGYNSYNRSGGDRNSNNNNNSRNNNNNRNNNNGRNNDEKRTGAGAGICDQYNDTGTCSRGSRCKFKHLDIHGVEQRKRSGICFDLLYHGRCDRFNCQWKHDIRDN